MDHNLQNNVTQNAGDVSFVFDDEITPVKACGDLTYCVNNCEMSKGLEKCGDPSCQVKRCRMLQFNSEVLDASLCNEETSSTCLIKGGQESVEEAFSEVPQWVSKYAEGTSASCCESLDQSSEAWLASCLRDADMQCSPSDTVSDVQIDMAELCESENLLKSKVTINQEHPVLTQRKVFKGRKSYMKTPAKLASSVVHPFAFIKPCAVHGDVTLKDINQQIRTPQPSKLRLNNDDPSYATSAFSGKPVVGKTKIQTKGGKGSITIVRTKG